MKKMVLITLIIALSILTCACESVKSINENVDFSKVQKAFPDENSQISLTSLVYTRKGYMIDAGVGGGKEQWCSDIYGVKYAPYNIICRNNSDVPLRWNIETNEEDASICYPLNCKYKQLTGTIFIPVGTLECNVPWGPFPDVKIYGDGALLYESSEIDSKVHDSVDLRVNVTGVRELKIVIEGVWWDSIESEYNPIVCLGNMILSK